MVDLPAPFSPTSAMTRPAYTFSAAPERAFTPGNDLSIPLSCSNASMMASESDASTENDIRIRGTLPAANHRLTVCGLLFELFVRCVTNFYGVSLVLLQLLNVAEQRFVELRIMLFNFRRENGCLNLHLRRHHFKYLHKRGNTLR